jgi:hypothetical protein
MISPFQRSFSFGWRLLCTGFLLSTAAHAQSAPAAPPAKADDTDLSAKLDLLTKSLQQTQVELAESRTEIQQLRASLEEALKRMEKVTAPTPSAAAEQKPATAAANALQAANSPEARPAQISQDDWDILNARLEEQRQTKVESASKYRLKLSGIALFNAFSTSGQVDNLDLPSIATPRFVGFPRAGTGASIRQSIIGLTGIGPVLFGARTSGDLQTDFYGGLPYGYGSTSSGIARVRLARIRFDWKDTSIVAGLDYAFFSPNLPTTYVSLAVPGFASAGNLWTWTPTVRVEHRFANTFLPLKVEAGLLDPASSINYSPNSNLRFPNSTEYSRQPTYAMRLSANGKSEERPASVGVSGVFSPQSFFGGYHVYGWLGILDWKFPMLPHTELSGQFFTGRGADGFGGVPLNPFPPQNLFLYATVTTRVLAEVGAIGGWSQFKFRVNSRSEFNVAAGTGGHNSKALRGVTAYDASVNFIPARNQMLFANYIFKPRSDLLFSAEYRRLRTYELIGAPDTAGQVGLAVGFLF